MKKFLKFALKSQWKTISVILVLVILQTFFQIEIISLFGAALRAVESGNVDLLLYNGKLMLAYTLISAIFIYAISFLTTGVSSKAAYHLREKIFHILMNLPDEEINRFKITGLITRSTRGIFSQQGFIIVMLKYFIRIPIVFVGIVVKIALIDRIFAALFAAVIIILSVILVLKLNQVTTLFFKAKKTYGKINMLFLSKINNLVSKVAFNKRESRNDFEKACEDSYDKNVKYLLSQYYIGPVLLLVLQVIVVFLLAMMVLGSPVGFEVRSAVDSVVIIQYILYFIATAAVIPAIIEMWPRSYATSVRLEEVLNLENKIIKTSRDDVNPKRIEIIQKDIADDENEMLVDRWGIIRKFNNVLDQHRRTVLLSMILVTVSSLCIAYAPKVAGDIINIILMDSDGYLDHALFSNVALLFALYSLGCLFKLPSNRFMALIGEEIAYKLRMALFEKLDELDSSFIQQNSKGHILSRLNNDLMNIREFISLHMSEIFAQLLIIIFVIILSLMTEWRLSLIYLITLLIYMVSIYIADVKSRMPYENHQRHLGRMMSYFERSLKDRCSFHENGFEKINRTVSDNFIESRNISNIILPAATVLTTLSNIAVYIAGVYFLITFQIDLGTLLAVIIYGQLLTKPLKKLSIAIIFLEISFSSIKRIFAIIDFKNNEK